MFESLTGKLEGTFKRLRNRGKLSDADIDEALGEIRDALLEADVNLQVAKDFCSRVKEKASGKDIIKSLTPGQMVIKYVHDSLLEAMGEFEPLNLKYAPPVVIMLVGLQGSGKTTSCGKLAKYLRDELKRRPLLVPADVYRPAAIEQLKKLGADLDIEVLDVSPDEDPVKIAERGEAHAKSTGLDVMILDTAGRLQIDQELMNELAEIVEAIDPHEILLVADAMTGQEAVNVAKGFDELLEIDGLVLTKMDGDARGGAALSMRAVTNKPIKFIGIGEKSDALELFHPDRMAGRILGKGDILTLIEKASKQISEEEAKKLEKKIKKAEFNLEDFHSQLQSIKSMGSIGGMMKMIPGMGSAASQIDDEVADKQMSQIEAIILSMTPAERKNPELLDGSRRKRIAKGSGTSVEEINRMIKQFTDMRKLMKKFSKGGKGMRGMANLAQNLKHKGGLR
jgi:signal recognition particle subunit SRP54